MKKGQQITNWNQLERGDAYSYTSTSRPKHLNVVDWDGGFDSPVSGMVYRGKGCELAIPGLAYPAFVVGKVLVVGCQNMDADEAFRALGKLLGYEVTP